MFSDDVELRFLECKNDLDNIHYSLIRLQDGDLAFELHQRLIEAEASFEELATAYSEGPERNEQGRIGPVPLSQPHPLLMNVLRTSQPGQIREPILINDTWVIVRLDQWNGARLDDGTREQLLEELFESWIQQRAGQYLSGEMPEPLPLHRLYAAMSCSSTTHQSGKALTPSIVTASRGTNNRAASRTPAAEGSVKSVALALSWSRPRRSTSSTNSPPKPDNQLTH